MNIYLIGFMGSGKSTLGRLLAHRLGQEFVDTDDWIERRARKTIAEIFRSEGEAHFRQLETLCISEIAQKKNLVVALGGGAPIKEENWQMLKSTGLSISRADIVVENNGDDPEETVEAILSKLNTLWKSSR